MYVCVLCLFVVVRANILLLLFTRIYCNIALYALLFNCHYWIPSSVK
jgi:hypothetical protein